MAVQRRLRRALRRCCCTLRACSPEAGLSSATTSVAAVAASSIVSPPEASLPAPAFPAAALRATKVVCTCASAIPAAAWVTDRPTTAPTGATEWSRGSCTCASGVDVAAARVAAARLVVVDVRAPAVFCMATTSGVASFAISLSAVPASGATCTACAAAARSTVRTLPKGRSALLAHWRSSPTVTR